MTLDQTGASTDVLRRNGRSFHWAGQLLSGDQMASAASLYSLCRRIDDLADEAVTPSQRVYAGEQLHALNEALAHGAPPAEPQKPVYEQASDLLGGYPVAMEALQELIATVQQDLNPVHMTDHAELLQYCYGVAGTVGVMMSCLLGAEPRARALPHAIDLGIAMQMTNIARDVLEDAELGRVYLPAKGAAGHLHPGALVRGDVSSRHNAWLGVRELLSHAETYYASGWQGLWYLPARPRIAIAVAARLYREIGRQILRRGEAAYWQRRSMVGPLRKIQVSLAAVVRLALIPSPDKASGHDALLHRDLSTYPGANQRNKCTAAERDQRAERGYGS
ncbi:phytoene/squalene synthase family protein [Vreelandella utahensis]|uniref:phytoene/squalene synthase family protein n=1 Tax=Vreelandella halophila TaxID=86177 RepID=UPI0009858B3F|nr:phytoene/squalene synthase family protein [Halomonas utahensis]